MEATFAASRSNTVKFYYSKRKNSIGTETRRSAVGGQSMWSGSSSSSVLPPPPPPCKEDQFEVGAFYEIDHGKLPPKSPIQLKALRVVKVSEITTLDLTVNFPSIFALRNYFMAKPSHTRADVPELDEKFVMSYNYAARSLRRVVLASQLEAEKQQQSFWLTAPLLQPENAEVEETKRSMSAAVSSCFMALKSSGVLQWGTRRRVKYIGRHTNTPRKLIVPAVKKDEAEETDEVAGHLQQQCTYIGRKRIHDACRKDRAEKKKGKIKKKKSSNKKPKLELVTTVKAENAIPAVGSGKRWSRDRYKSSELKLLEIMREKGAEIGNPILRQELRVEARKHIGDTGLLDHLLKHMAGKVVGKGTDRFQRRHNADGAMEYWLEPAELMEIRKSTGVADPYWVPPAGWKVGDATSLCVCGGECKKETSRLKEEMALIERDMEQLRSLKQQLEKEKADAQTALTVDRCCTSSGDWQEKYEKLIQCTARMEAQMAAFTSTIGELKEEVEVLKEEKEKREKAIQVAVTEEAAKQCVVADDVHGQDKKKKKMMMAVVETNASTNNNISGMTGEESPSHDVVGNMGPVGVGRSGFRLCKPQGTFLWPNMGAAASAAAGGGGGNSGTSMISRSGGAQMAMVPPAISNHHYQQQQQQQQQMMMLFGGGGSTSTATGGGIPTPPSVSSTSTSPNKLFLHPSPTTPTSNPPPPLLMLPPHVLTRIAECGGVVKKSGEKASGGGKRGEGETSNVTTDLALAPPSPYA